MLHPKYNVEIGSTVFKPELSNENISMSISASMNSPSDIFEGIFRLKGKAVDMKKQDIVKVSLGYEDGMYKVYQGKVVGLGINTYDISVTAYSSTFSLSCLRKDKFYEQRTAGQIVKDLANMAGVEPGDVEDGIKFPYYAVDSNKNGYEHIKELALLSGYDIYSDSNDRLVFKKYNPLKFHDLTYGKDIARVASLDFMKRYGGVNVIGESPASVNGQETAHWLKKESMQSSIGGQDDALLIINRAVKDEDTAKKIAEENLNNVKSHIEIVMDIVGNPEILLGDGVRLNKVPNDILNGDYQVRSVEHHFGKKKGFMTTIQCKGKSNNE